MVFYTTAGGKMIGEPLSKPEILKQPQSKKNPQTVTSCGFVVFFVETTVSAGTAA
jgi:hypothetical protein